MKTMVPLLLVSGTLLIGGCATTPSQVASNAQYDIDYQKVYLVNNWARRNNVEVVWINYPQRVVRTAQQ